MSAVWELDLPMNDKFVLLAFADHADDSGFCHPSFERAAWKCGVSKHTVRRAVRRFRNSGVMVVLTEALGRGHTPRYQIKTERGTKLAPLVLGRGTNGDKKGVPTRTERGTKLVHPESSFLEPSINQKDYSYYSHPIYGEVRRKRRDADQESLRRRRAGVR
jgi:Helix-turn-helix domain